MSKEIKRENIEKRIRKRKSYAMWEELHDFIDKNRDDTVAILERIFKLLDRKGAFGTETNSLYSYESLQQFRIDKMANGRVET